MANRFPEWERQEWQSAPRTDDSEKPTLTGLFEEWWTQAKALGRSSKTHQAYGSAINKLRTFLGHDNATRISVDDVIRFRDHRLAEINPRTGKLISPKTVKDADLAGIKAVFGWAVENRKLSDNPAANVTLRLGRQPKLREKGFTDEEAAALLRAAMSYEGSAAERPQTKAAKRWIPWLCAYTGARVGEIAQLRREDVRKPPFGPRFS